MHVIEISLSLIETGTTCGRSQSPVYSSNHQVRYTPIKKIKVIMQLSSIFDIEIVMRMISLKNIIL